MNDTLMQQCRREAEERYPMPVFESGNYAHPSPSAPVELSEEDIERMVTEAVPGFAIGFAKELVSHITKHYTLHPKP